MDFQIDVQKDILEQFATQLGLEITDNRIFLNSGQVKGEISSFQFADQIELYHFSFTLGQALVVHSINPPESKWLLLNINLSQSKLVKTVNGQELQFQRLLSSGVLFYSPDTEVIGGSPTNEACEIVLLRMPIHLLEQYEAAATIILGKSQILYEDLDPASEAALRKALVADNVFQKHAAVLSFCGLMVEKILTGEREPISEKIHPQDIKALFMAAALIRDPLLAAFPSVEMLAQTAGMGLTKFKQSFRQLFGLPPRKYHQKIRMEYARTELLEKGRTATDVSYSLGYSHPSKFTQAYKKHFGSLPSQLR
ncbi:MAG: helix-turn-helix transcriptional regulator [Bacteroidota bacterium]